VFGNPGKTLALVYEILHLTDHLPVFQITNFQPQQHTAPVNIKTRKITQSSILNFQNELQEINWDETRLNTSPNHS
jgi:hypothetical protein